ncbi:MAG: 4-hydroxy-3-methylbut-2-enyl diphosphate reductase [Oscillospiraceae bacterium]|nr:4-hydroxy-3-methylbut-2-enyl diphosphate reductase [Oscillospiraceae bacterium]
MITKMQESGFCAGVRHAVEKAREQHKNITCGKNVYLYGDLVNNAYVMREFLNKGFRAAGDIKTIPEGSVVIIRAHGAPRHVYEELKNKNITVEDCTCISVKNIHRIVNEKSSEGYKIIIAGKAEHPEVTGILGWCSGEPGCVTEKAEELENTELSGKICLVSQTTFNKEAWKNISERVLQKNSSAEIYNTLCNVTGEREKKAKIIAESSDLMLIIGDEKSSNSGELYKICRMVCKNTFFTESLASLVNNAVILKKIAESPNIGLAAGASIPDDIIAEVYSYLVFVDFMKTAKQEIETALSGYFNSLSSDTADNPIIKKALDSLIKQNEGGKRIRGAMIKLGEKIASGGQNENYIPVAAGYELFQTSVLIHDDIADKSVIRRNKPTIHSESGKEIKALNSKITAGNAAHYGISRALCIGDYGFFISYRFLSKTGVESSVLTKIYELYSKILSITCEGEIMDVTLPFDNISITKNYDEYQKIVGRIYEYKTAWYTLAGPVMLGALCGGADDELLLLLENITLPLGVAFQIKDDLLGIYSAEDILGKSVLSDIRENKQTLMYGYAYKNADKEQKELISRHYGKKTAGKNSLSVIQKLFEETGARAFCESEIRRLCGISRELISAGSIDSEFKTILYGLVSYLTDRKF